MRRRSLYKSPGKRIIRLICRVTLLGIVFVCLLNFLILKISRAHISDSVDELPQAQAVLIPGARVYEDGRMSDILNDRVISALEVYHAGKADKILVSGDHGRTEYDEVNTVKNRLLAEGVPETDIFLDHAGFDTYDSLYRARDIFEADSLIVSTQEFHLPRAVYIGNSLGIETYGYIADKQPYLAARRNEMREFPARIKAFLNVTFHSKPKYLGDAIPISGDGRQSWD